MSGVCYTNASQSLLVMPDKRPVSPGGEIELGDKQAQASGVQWFIKHGWLKPRVSYSTVDIEDLRDQAKELGIEFDGRWGAARLQAAIDKTLTE